MADRKDGSKKPGLIVSRVDGLLAGVLLLTWSWPLMNTSTLLTRWKMERE